MYSKIFGGLHRRQISQVAKSSGRFVVVDKATLVKKLEGQGVPQKQVEAITAAITEASNETIGNSSQYFAAKGEIGKDHRFSKFQLAAEEHQNDKEMGDGERRFVMSESLQNTIDEIKRDLEAYGKEVRGYAIKGSLMTLIATAGACYLVFRRSD